MKITKSQLVQARARVSHRSGEMNSTEKAYAAELDKRQQVGEIAQYWFESITFKLAADTRYTPDFIVQLSDGTFEAHEVKGFWRDDAKVKIKVAAAMFPFQFVAVQVIPKKLGGGWKIQEF